jgi:5-(carboxyamino)imidazole ribonucleotide synthase
MIRRTVGIVGAGQLARMTAQAAIPLDIGIVLLAADEHDGAAQIVPDVIVGSPDDRDLLATLADRCEVVTFDHELVDPVLLAELEAEGHRVWPSSASMALAQNKRRQRRELGDAGFRMPMWLATDDLVDIEAFGRDAGWPIVLKASSGGYDGRGVWTAGDFGAARAVWDGAQTAGTVLLAEEWLELELELAVLVARTPSGDSAVYPATETVQRDGICRELRVPCRLDPVLIREAEDTARAIAEAIGIVGIMAVEFFVAGGLLYINELAPRPHNSGHWTIEGATTSQFEQHLRAVLDLPLGDTAPTADGIATVNLLGRGDAYDPRSRLAHGLAVPGAHIHLYGKDPRPGRKVGHVTACGQTLEDAHRMATDAADRLLGTREASAPRNALHAAERLA